MGKSTISTGPFSSSQTVSHNQRVLFSSPLIFMEYQPSRGIYVAIAPEGNWAETHLSSALLVQRLEKHFPYVGPPFESEVN